MEAIQNNRRQFGTAIGNTAPDMSASWPRVNPPKRSTSPVWEAEAAEAAAGDDDRVSRTTRTVDRGAGHALRVSSQAVAVEYRLHVAASPDERPIRRGAPGTVSPPGLSSRASAAMKRSVL